MMITAGKDLLDQGYDDTAFMASKVWPMPEFVQDSDIYEHAQQAGDTVVFLSSVSIGTGSRTLHDVERGENDTGSFSTGDFVIERAWFGDSLDQSS